MADSKLTGLTANTNPALTDLTYLVDDPGGTPLSQKITVADLLAVASPTFTTPVITGPVTLNEAIGSSGLTITGATQTSSFPVLSATQTWNNAGTTFTAIKANVTSTASAAGSLLMDLQVGGTTQFNVGKGGTVTTKGTGSFGDGVIIASSSSATGLFLWTSWPLNWNNDTKIFRDDAQVVAIRYDATSPNTLRIYEAFTDASNYERASLSCASNTVTLAAETAGTGSDDMDIALTPAGAGDVRINKALVALGGGAAPTLGTIGGSGPATAGQNTWLQLKDSAGVACWVPVWK